MTKGMISREVLGRSGQKVAGGRKAPVWAVLVLRESPKLQKLDQLLFFLTSVLSDWRWGH